MKKGFEILLEFINETEDNIKNDKYDSEQLKKIAEASPKMLDICSKATMPFVKESGEKSFGLEKARADVAKKILAKIENEGIENINTEALKEISSFSLYSFKSVVENYVSYSDDEKLKYTSEREKKEFIERDKNFGELLLLFFNIMENVNKENSGIIEKIKEFFGDIFRK